MKRKNPHAKGAGASYEAGHFEAQATAARPILQANEAMLARLKLLRWSEAVRHG